MKGTQGWARGAMSRIAVGVAVVTYAAAPGKAMAGTSVESAVVITMPRDGERFEVDTSAFTIGVKVADAIPVDRVDLYVNGEYRSYSESSPYGWVTHGSPAGAYELYAVAIDDDGDEYFSEPITIFVGRGDGPGDLRLDAPPPSASEAPTSGCSIADDRGPVAPLALGVVLVAAARRRRP